MQTVEATNGVSLAASAAAIEAKSAKAGASDDLSIPACLDRTKGKTPEQIKAETAKLKKENSSKEGQLRAMRESKASKAAPAPAKVLTEGDLKDLKVIEELKKQGAAAGKTGMSPFAMKKAGAPLKSETAPKAAAAKKTAKAAKTPKAANPAKGPAAPRKQPAERARYDWNGAREAAAKGVIPKAPDFSANTHRSYRGLLAEVEALVKAKDLAGLQAYKVKGSSTSPAAVKRYREIALIALKAKK